MSNALLTSYVCTSCGAEAPEGKKFCAQCGAPVQVSTPEAEPVPVMSASAAPAPAASVPAASAPVTPASAPSSPAVPVSAVQTTPTPPVVSQPLHAPAVAQGDFIPSKTSKYEPISTKGYIGIWLLMMIPAVNLLLLIIWACGGCRKINKRNYARSMLIIWVIALVLGGILSLIFGKAISDSLAPFITIS